MTFYGGSIYIKIIMTLIILLFIFLTTLCVFRYTIVPYTIKNHTQSIDFNHIKFPTSPNFYYSPAKNGVFNVSMPILKAHWDSLIKEQPRVKELRSIKNGDQRTYVQLSNFWHFPDFIDVKFIPLSSHRSSLAIYSRSRFGYGDFGVNKRRVKHWLLLLKKSLEKKNNSYDNKS